MWGDLLGCLDAACTTGEPTRHGSGLQKPSTLPRAQGSSASSPRPPLCQPLDLTSIQRFNSGLLGNDFAQEVWRPCRGGQQRPERRLVQLMVYWTVLSSIGLEGGRTPLSKAMLEESFCLCKGNHGTPVGEGAPHQARDHTPEQAPTCPDVFQEHGYALSLVVARLGWSGVEGMAHTCARVSDPRRGQERKGRTHPWTSSRRAARW